ncbi:dihydroorotase [Sphingomonas sp. C3-2]|uniref:dihydroorotase n=1 Tax=Sphingomonas sp. C3-2 TaxID=3062169 RepID=UPI00294AFB27|nr:dihydroorotase [Sphingomonas sp. C3-2]WOK36852.1 dihydroorotase [Sphingomonas sp. C3-2]
MTMRAILNGRLVLDQGAPTPGGVLVQGDTIVAIGQFDVPADADVIDAQGGLIAPGIVDLGVFAVDPPACRAGGITRVALMPDQSPPLDEPGLIQRAAASGKPDHLWVHPIGAATRGLEGTEMAEFALMQSAGARAVATGRRGIASSGAMQRVLAYAQPLGLMLITHAEDDGLSAGAVATSGEIATRLGLPCAPAISEAMAIARDLALAEITGAHVHFRQVTTQRGFDLIREAKAKGNVKLSCGITPAHLYLSDIETADFRTFARLSPPLRDDSDRKAALAAIADGTIDVLCSGHDPRGPEDKRLPFADAVAGMAGAETLLALALGLVRDGLIDEAGLFRLLAANPARLLGLNAGRIAVDAPADVIVVDVDAPWKIDSDRMVARAGNTPFDGLPVQGKVRHLLKGGQPVG